MTQRPTGAAKENTKKARKSPMPASRGRENGECGVSKELHDAFVLFDVNHDGRITEFELNSVLSFLGIKASASDVKRMIADADIDGNGTVEYNEFIRMMNRYSEKTANCPDAEMLEAFRVFDHNNDAYIDHEEIKRTMHFLGETVSDDDVRAMIKEADADHDGLVDFEEFKRMMELKIKMPTAAKRPGKQSSALLKFIPFKSLSPAPLSSVIIAIYLPIHQPID
uniref:Calmodulin n=1 Tax=Echinococcus granulosus TaxID=6210 RepID=A0A068WQ23_ECHGR|nr:calmodulin [Echinococcus granulosus]